MTKNERKKICGLMDCKKLSMDACMHAAQNERLPLRVVVQVNPPQYSSVMLKRLESYSSIFCCWWLL